MNNALHCLAIFMAFFVEVASAEQSVAFQMIRTRNYSVCIPNDSAVRVNRIDSTGSELTLDLLFGQYKDGTINIRYLEISEKFPMNIDIFDSLPYAQMQANMGLMLAPGDLFHDVSHLNLNNKFPSRSLSFKVYQNGQTGLPLSDGQRVLLALAANLVITPLSGIVIIPSGLMNGDELASSPKTSSTVVVHNQWIQNGSMNGVVSAVMNTATQRDIHLHFFEYIAHSFRPPQDSSAGKTYTPYSSCTVKLITNDGSIGQGYLDKIDDTHIYYRKSRSTNQIRVSKKQIRLVTAGTDTLFVR